MHQRAVEGVESNRRGPPGELCASDGELLKLGFDGENPARHLKITSTKEAVYVVENKSITAPDPFILRGGAPGAMIYS